MNNGFVRGKHCRQGRNRVRSIALAGAVMAGMTSAQAQIATLDKGHQLLLNGGLQIWGLNTDSFQYTFNYNNLTAANMNAVMYSHGQSNTGALSPGQKWGKWVDYHGNPSTALDATEMAHYSDLVAIQVGDEQQSDLESPTSATKAWFDAAHSSNLFTDKLLYVNSAYANDAGAYINFVASANPDAISWDAYPFGTTGVYPYNWLGKAQFFRRVALGSYIGATGSAPRPYGLYLQTYHGGDGARDPSDLEMRWQQFTAWTLGYTFVDCFTAGGGNTSLFNSGNGNSPHQPTYDQFKESARQSRNLGPALTRLISTGYGPSIVLGKDPSGNTNPVPVDWPVFNKANAPAGQQFLSSLSAVNLGTKNGGNPGDLYVGFFNPLLASDGDPAGEAYFMVTNALGAYLQDPTGLVSEYQQSVTLNFDFGTSGVTSLQRLRRSDGQLEILPLTRVSGGNGNLYQLMFTLDGGTGDLFKFNDGTPFVGAPAVGTRYWDNDGSASGNNTTTGAGLGGTGSWGASSSNWYDGTSTGMLAGNRDVVFMGTAGTVTLASAQAVNSLAFKSNGYTLTGSTLTMNGSVVTVDNGMNATIGSVVAGTVGLIKNGSGTLVLGGANTYGGGTIVNGGMLRVGSDANLGAVPSALTSNVTLNGATLQFAGSFTLGSTRGINIGTDGGTIDTQGFDVTFSPTNGFRGGDLTKVGSGTFFASATTGGANTLWTGNLIIKEGTWKIIASDGLPYNPTSGVLRPAQVTLDGGTWQWGANVNVTNGNRGITVGAGGGTIDTQGFNVTWSGPITGSAATAVLTKAGSGSIKLRSAAFESDYVGALNVAGGTVQLDGGRAMGDLAAVTLANTAGVTLSVTAGDETIGSLAGGGTLGGNVSLGAQTLTAGGNGKSTTFAGVISGANGKLVKVGTGTMVLAGANTYTGGTTVSAGTLELGAGGTVGSGGVVVQGGVFRLASGGPTAVLSSLVLAGGKADLTDRRLVIDYTTGNDPVASVVSALLAGRNGGAWDGVGIISSSAAGDAQKRTAIGWAEQSDMGVSSWGGTGVDATSLLLRYTYYGDANLDGKVNADDFARADRGRAKGLSGWVNGDFNYDGTVNAADYLLMDSTYVSQGGPLSPALLAEREAQFGIQYVNELMAAVPEPTGMGLCGAAAMVAGMRRRRQRPK